MKSGQHRNKYSAPLFYHQKHDPWFGLMGGNDQREKEKAVKIAKNKRNKK